jgi:hypothetical protein
MLELVADLYSSASQSHPGNLSSVRTHVSIHDLIGLATLQTLAATAAT